MGPIVPEPGEQYLPGPAKAPRQDAEETRAIVEYHDRLSAHPSLLTAIVPMRDSVSISLRIRT